MSSFNQRECFGCGHPCDGYHCYSCTCPQCGVILLNGSWINCIYRNGKPVTCCECEGPLRGGFCLFCNSKTENSFIYDPNAYSFNDTSSTFNHFPQPQLCGNNSHCGYAYQQQFPFVYEHEPSYNQDYNNNHYPHDSLSFLCCDNCGESHKTFQCQPIDQNNDSFGFEQIQPSQYPVIHHPFQEMSEEVFQAKEYINSPSYNYPTFYNDDEELSIQYKEYLENSSDAIAPILPTEEPEYSLSMGYEHLSTTPETELDEVIKSSAKSLVPIPSEYEVTSDDENTLIDSSPEFDFLLKELFGKRAHINPILPGIKEAEFDLEKDIRLVKNLLYDNSSLRPPEELNAEITDTIVESLSPSPILVEDGDFLMDEIDLFLATDDLLPPGIENFDYDSKEDIHFLEELLSDDSIPLPENESSKFDHQDDLSFPRPPPEPSDIEFFFKPNSGELISVVKNNNDELSEDDCFDPGGEIDDFSNVEDDDYFPFLFVIRILLPYLIYPEVSPLLLSAGSEDTISDTGSSYNIQSIE
nr:hypothetical protein [Tanacetum cinerariifolium]